MALLYDKTVTYNGEREQVLNAARDTFVQQGFLLTSVSKDGFDVRGPGMSSTKQNPLVGVSQAHLSASASDITIRAELGGVRVMQYFVMIFPPALVLGLGILFYFVLPNGEMFAKYMAPGFMLQWLLLGLLLSYWIRRRTTRAVDVLLQNAVAIAGASR